MTYWWRRSWETASIQITFWAKMFAATLVSLWMYRARGRRSLKQKIICSKNHGECFCRNQKWLEQGSVGISVPIPNFKTFILISSVKNYTHQFMSKYAICWQSNYYLKWAHDAGTLKASSMATLSGCVQKGGTTWPGLEYLKSRRIYEKFKKTSSSYLDSKTRAKFWRPSTTESQSVGIRGSSLFVSINCLGWSTRRAKLSKSK